MQPSQAPKLTAGPVGLPDGDFVMVEWADPGGVTGPDRPIAGRHVHHSDDEAWYVIEGTLGFRLGEDVVEAGQGECVFVAHGTPHSFWNARPNRARYVLVMSPRLHRLVKALHSGGSRDFAEIFREHDSELL